MTEISVAPDTTCALVTMTPAGRPVKPVASPGTVRVLGPPPNMPPKNGSAGTRSTVVVCTVTTAGATDSTAAVIAVRRPSLIRTLVRAGDDAPDCWALLASGARAQPRTSALAA